MNDPHVHHDALEFPDGEIVKVTRLDRDGPAIASLCAGS
jgi:hypothetical protein